MTGSGTEAAISDAVSTSNGAGSATTEGVASPLATSLAALADEVWSMAPDDAWAALPADLAENHDHYLYGVPKRS